MLQIGSTPLTYDFDEILTLVLQMNRLLILNELGEQDSADASSQEALLAPPLAEKALAQLSFSPQAHFGFQRKEYLPKVFSSS